MISLSHHWHVFKESWVAESARRKEKRQAISPDFLPAALEVLERPPSPLGRAMLWLTCSLFLAALLWATLGHVDVVATAQGKTLPVERVKMIQAAEYGIVRAIHVTEGQVVKAGQPLVDLDTSVSTAEEGQAQQQLIMARLDMARGEALLDYLGSGRLTFASASDLDVRRIDKQRRLAQAQIDEYAARLATVDKQREERLADLAVVTRELEKLDQMLPLLGEQVSARAELTEKGLSPRLVLLELKERQIAMQMDAQVQRENLIKMQASIGALDQERDRIVREFRRTVIADLTEAEAQATLAGEEVKKASSRRSFQRLVAPVDGIVQQLSVHTIGGVVEPAAPLMVVVPGDGRLIVEASLQNKDAGFVLVGDPVEVKLEAFPFTKFGVIEGHVDHISPDAVQTEDQGLIYLARVELDRQDIEVNGRAVPLTSGMTATAEIKTGRRRLIEYLLSPLLRYKQESFRER